jgi:hypothetical protein
MTNYSRFQVAICGMGSLALLSVSGAQPAHIMLTAKVKPIPYAKISPLIKAQCVSCHNAKNHPEKVDLSSYHSLMKSGEHGPIVVAGHPEKSKLIMYVDGQKQPRMPMNKPPLSPAQIAELKAWIAAGAKG